MSAVVQVITTLARGGAQRVALDLATKLDRPSRRQYLIAGAPGELDDEARARLGPRFLHAPSMSNAKNPLLDLLAVDEIVRHLARIQRAAGGGGGRGGAGGGGGGDGGGDGLVVHTHSIKAGLVGRIAARVVGAKAVHTLHGFAFDVLGGGAGPGIITGIERFAAAFGDVQLFVSEADLATARRLGIGPRARSLVVRPGVDVARFRGIAGGATNDGAGGNGGDGAAPLAASATAARDVVRRRRRAALDLPESARVAVTVANMKPQKDPLFHVDVLREWRALDPDARLVFLGDGPLRAAMLERARAAGVVDALVLPGAVDDVRPFLAAADVMLLASAWEGLPISVLEGLASGLPCVVRDSGWAVDLEFAKDTALTALGARAPASAFARALDRAARHPRTQLEIPAAFTVDGMLAQISSIYDALGA